MVDGHIKNMLLANAPDEVAVNWANQGVLPVRTNGDWNLSREATRRMLKGRPVKEITTVWLDKLCHEPKAVEVLLEEHRKPTVVRAVASHGVRGMSLEHYELMLNVARSSKSGPDSVVRFVEDVVSDEYGLEAMANLGLLTPRNVRSAFLAAALDMGLTGALQLAVDAGISPENAVDAAINQYHSKWDAVDVAFAATELNGVTRETVALPNVDYNGDLAPDRCAELVDRLGDLPGSFNNNGGLFRFLRTVNMGVVPHEDVEHRRLPGWVLEIIESSNVYDLKVAAVQFVSNWSSVFPLVLDDYAAAISAFDAGRMWMHTGTITVAPEVAVEQSGGLRPRQDQDVRVWNNSEAALDIVRKHLRDTPNKEDAVRNAFDHITNVWAPTAFEAQGVKDADSPFTAHQVDMVDTAHAAVPHTALTNLVTLLRSTGLADADDVYPTKDAWVVRHVSNLLVTAAVRTELLGGSTAHGVLDKQGALPSLAKRLTSEVWDRVYEEKCTVEERPVLKRLFINLYASRGCASCTVPRALSDVVFKGGCDDGAAVDLVLENVRELVVTCVLLEDEDHLDDFLASIKAAGISGGQFARWLHPSLSARRKVMDSGIASLSQLVAGVDNRDAGLFAPVLASAVEARFGGNPDAWEAFSNLAGDWEGTLSELLDTVESMS